MRTGAVADALMPEGEPAPRAHPAIARLADAVHHGLDGATGEAQARRLAREVALLVQAALLQQSSPAAVADAFCVSRLEQSADVFGLLPPGVDLDAVVARALPQEA